AVTATSLAATPASAGYMDGMNLRRDTFELGLGLGFGHRDVSGYDGLGVNLELGYGLTSAVELRLRSGLRFADAGRIVQADRYGRPVDTETYNTGYDTLANPEIGLLFNLVRGGTAEIGIDARLTLPIDGDPGLLLGLPINLRLGSAARLDTGVYLPIVFYDPDTRIDLSVPLRLYFRLGGGSFLGPILGIYKPEGGGTIVPFGIGGGASIAYDAEVRFWLMFDDIANDGGAKNFGLGIGLYVDF
ncbi:MAG TPA: hypothetical protein VGF45_19815, partial [Polyangia bacterium]